MKKKMSGYFTYDDNPKAIKKACSDCSAFLKELKPWNERKIPSVCMMAETKCTKCGADYEVYGGMARMKVMC